MEMEFDKDIKSRIKNINNKIKDPETGSGSLLRNEKESIIYRP